ncbi:MAG: DUF4276 family protein [Phormidium sp. BM_Day4_Bin.17]|nr:DUF4276 family protein [Phormidium sp. BM_Day4_Bin.17]UCJ14308.1 MAG: DUF4276 family protein [Phormidium sp. PBR-2020]
MFAEGQTEQTFADNLIRPHLANYGVYLNKPILISHGRRKGKVHRGGGQNYAAMKQDILRLLNQDKSRDVYFTTMLDLYALPSEFPGFTTSQNYRNAPYRQVRFLETSFADDIGDNRFLPHLQLYEYEAYLFCEPKYFLKRDPGGTKGAETLQDIANQYESPELINDGSQTAPSKRIIAEFPRYKKSKSVWGPLVAQDIGLAVIRQQCPHFNEWLSRLESLAQL